MERGLNGRRREDATGFPEPGMEAQVIGPSLSDPDRELLARRKRSTGSLSPTIQALVMIPTYNEALNLRALVEAVVAQPGGFGALIVDDNSPDGTGALADQLAAEHKGSVLVIHRLTERGRGSAGIAGFRRGLELEVPYLLEMDADFSHNPADLPRLLHTCESGADVAIGSRYVLGGKQVGRTFVRELISVASNVVYRLILGVPVRDVSGGFKCYRRAALAALDWPRFFSQGYSIGMETVFRLHCLGFSLKETPIVFADRQLGQSKFRLREARLCLWVALRLVVKFGRGGFFRGSRPSGSPLAFPPSARRYLFQRENRV